MTPTSTAWKLGFWGNGNSTSYHVEVERIDTPCRGVGLPSSGRARGREEPQAERSHPKKLLQCRRSAVVPFSGSAVLR